MSRIKKALISIIMMVILTSIFSTISNAKGWGKNPEDSDFNAEHIKVGDTLSLTAEWASAHKDLFCVVKTQQFGDEKKYKAVSKIAIEGLNATNTHGKTIKSKYNGYLAWILNHSDGKGGFGNGDDKAQRWTWNFIGTWMNKVGYKFNIKNKYEGIWKGFTNKPGFIATWETQWNYTSWKTGAKAYVKSLKKLKVLKDKTEKDIKVEKYGNDKLKIGPFNFEFGGKLSEFVLSDQNGKKVKNVTFVVKNGSKDKKVKLSKIKTGKDFYAIIPINSGVSSISNVKVTNKYDYIYAKVVFWRYTGNSEKSVNYQNVIQFVTDKKPETITKDWDKDIPLLINISGKVWEDIHDAKGNTYAAYGENTYKEGDKLLQGITVRLKDNNGNTTIKETLTGENGEYRFTDIEISNLKNYYVEFEYNGLTYTSVKPYTSFEPKEDDAITSKAVEVVAKRDELNKKFVEITNAGGINDRSHGYTRDANGNRTGTVTYENDTDHFLSTMGDLEYNNDNPEDPKWVYTKGGYEDMNDLNLTANTINHDGYDGYSLYDQFTSGNFSDGEIKNVNLGLRKREQPNISIKNDLKEVKVLINGYGTTYTKDLDGTVYGTKEYPNIEAKFESIEGYYRQIYPSDIQSSENQDDEAKKLKVYATYEIIVSNNSSSLSVSVPKIANYYDSRFTSIVDNGTYFPQGKLDGVELKKLNDEDHSEILKYDNGTEVNGYNTAYISTEEQINEQTNKPRIIEANKTMVINVTYRVNDETVLKLLSEGDQRLEAVSEVYAYSTYYSQPIEGREVGNIYAGIDEDSAPGNATPGKIETYEDDTGKALSFILTAKGARQIAGKVFEDATDSNLLITGAERKGNGQFDSDENGSENSVSGVKVKLLIPNEEAENEETETYKDAIYYPEAAKDTGEANKDIIDEDGKVKAGTSEELITGDDGEYIFKGVEPDNYLIQFTYTNGETKIVVPGENNKDVTVQNYKSTIITSENLRNAFNNGKVPTGWYKDSYVKDNYPSESNKRYSDAKDVYDERLEIDKELKQIDASTKPTITSLKARTPKIFIPVDLETIITESDNNTFVNKISNIDFGIVERPRQHATLEKEISNIKVTLLEGKVLVDGDPRKGNLDYVTVTGDSIYVTVDTEYLQGAHIEVKYDLTLTNSSEVDYISENYYNYGIISEDDKKVTFTRAALVDYVDKEYVLKAEENGNWKVIGNAEQLAQKGYNWDLTPEQEEQLLNNFSTIVKAEPVSEKDELEPGERKSSTIVVEKLLAPSDKELSYDNSGEVVTIGKNGGSSLYQETPGVYAKVLAGKPENTDLTPEENPDDPEPIVPEQPIKADAPTLVIIPPTGSTNNNVLYAIIGVISLSVLGAGTYGVRRFLKK